jgi:thiol-disulfide isomerase/thioredoxin
VGTLSACKKDGPATPGDQTGFISGKASGKGALTVLPVGKRGDPIELAGPKLGGGTIDLAAYRGKIVLLNVWGSWCGPCRQEAPYLQAAWDQTRGKGDVVFVGINTKEDADGAAEAFERRFGITYPSLVDADGSLLLTFRRTIPPQAIPSTLILDRQGRVAARIIGPSSRGNFVELIDQIRAEA